MSSRNDRDISGTPTREDEGPSFKKVVVWVLIAALGLLTLLWGQEGLDMFVGWWRRTFRW